MCSEYSIKKTDQEIFVSFGQRGKNISGREVFDQKVQMSLPAPILEIQDGQLVLTEALFPTPPPFPNSRMSDLKQNKKTGEEELVRIYDVPSWKYGFAHAPCIVPMSSFVEPVYWGDELGSAMKFSLKNHETIFVAGLRMIRNEQADKTTAGFSLITHTASDQMLNYHHRLIVLLKAKAAQDWLILGGSAEERFNFLLANRYVTSFEIEKDRVMAKKPQKRIDEQLAKLDKEMIYREFLEVEGLDG